MLELVFPFWSGMQRCCQISNMDCLFAPLKFSCELIFFLFRVRSGDSRGFGFLSLERDEDADAAIRALDETEWNGRIILVEKSKS